MGAQTTEAGLMGSGSGLLAWLRRAAWPAAAAGTAVLLAGLVLLTGLARPAAAAPGSASGKPGPGVLGVAGTFGLNPAPGPQGQTASYFKLSVAPGQAATATIVVTNLGDKTQTLALGRALGITAVNGGIAYQATVGGCAGASCWVTGLPSRVTLAAGDRESLAFTVRVPPKTPPGQYLSGIAAEPAAASSPVKVGSNGRSSAQAIIVDLVTVGVAITVGDPSTLVNRLSIRGVQGVDEGSVARLNLSVYNTGRTFSGGAGQASCQAAGHSHSYRLYANTVLPGDHEIVSVNTPGLPEGATVSCAIQLRYGTSQVLRWAGSVAIPSAAPVERIIHTGPGAYAEIPSSGGIPVWAIILMVLGGLILITLWGTILLRRRRSRNRSDSPSDQGPVLGRTVPTATRHEDQSGPR
jgi:hypothetical protein